MKEKNYDNSSVMIICVWKKEYDSMRLAKRLLL